MYDQYLVAEDNSVWCANDEAIIPKRKFVAQIQCDPRDYKISPSDTTVCDVQTGIALQLSIWLRGQRCLDTLPHFRTWRFL